MAVTPWTRLGRFVESRTREGVAFEISYPPDPGGLAEPMPRPFRLKLTLHPRYPGRYEPRTLMVEGQKLDRLIEKLVTQAEEQLPELDAVPPES